MTDENPPEPSEYEREKFTELQEWYHDEVEAIDNDEKLMELMNVIDGFHSMAFSEFQAAQMQAFAEVTGASEVADGIYAIGIGELLGKDADLDDFVDIDIEDDSDG